MSVCAVAARTRCGSAECPQCSSGCSCQLCSSSCCSARTERHAPCQSKLSSYRSGSRAISWGFVYLKPSWRVRPRRGAVGAAATERRGVRRPGGGAGHRRRQGPRDCGVAVLPAARRRRSRGRRGRGRGRRRGSPYGGPLRALRAGGHGAQGALPARCCCRAGGRATSVVGSHGSVPLGRVGVNWRGGGHGRVGVRRRPRVHRAGAPPPPFVCLCVSVCVA